jgi:hypothetical protein
MACGCPERPVGAISHGLLLAAQPGQPRSLWGEVVGRRQLAPRSFTARAPGV